jgi:endogenous inhibitor of DNA gyrase (YacG/DUF329 family)
MDNTITLIRPRAIHIVCPLCNGQQKFEMVKDDSFNAIWFPVYPFCCEVMRNSDTNEWNELIDHLIVKALLKDLN